MTSKLTSNGFTKIYGQQFCPSPVDSLHPQTPSPTMQYIQYSSVVLTPSTMSSPSPPSTDNYSPGYLAETEYHLAQSNLTSPIKQEPHHFANSIASLTNNILSSNMLSYQLVNQLNQQPDCQPDNRSNQQPNQQPAHQSNQIRNKRSADDSSANGVKRGRSRATAPNRNQQSNQQCVLDQTKCPSSVSSSGQPAASPLQIVSQSNQSKSQIAKQQPNGIDQPISKPTRIRRTRAKSPTLVQKLKKNRRMKANDRERNRMHTLNRALERLRDILPVAGTMAAVAASSSNGSGAEDTMSNCANKLTKIETLRFANRYILELSTMLQRDLSGLDASKSAEATLQECAMAAAASIASSPPPPAHLLLNNSQNRFNNFSSIFNTNSMISQSNGVLSTSSLSNDEDEDDLLMMVSDCMSNGDEDIFEPQASQPVYHMN